MECTFSPALVAKSAVPSTSESKKGEGNGTDAAQASGAGAERTESIHERLYKLRVRAEVLPTGTALSSSTCSALSTGRLKAVGLGVPSSQTFFTGWPVFTYQNLRQLLRRMPKCSIHIRTEWYESR